MLPLFLIGLWFYILPSIIAAAKVPALRNGARHPHLAGIVIVNLGLGWTLLGWIVALVWAVTPPRA